MSAEDYQLLLESGMIMSCLQALQTRLLAENSQECAAFWLTYDNGPQIIYVDSFAADLLLRVEHVCVYNIIMKGNLPLEEKKNCTTALNAVRKLVSETPKVVDFLATLIEGDICSVVGLEQNTCRGLAASCLLSMEQDNFKSIMKTMITQATEYLMTTVAKSQLKINYNLEPNGIPYLFKCVREKMQSTNEMIYQNGLIVPDSIPVPQVYFQTVTSFNLARLLNPLYLSLLCAFGGSDLKRYFDHCEEKHYVALPSYIDYTNIVKHTRALFKENACKRTLFNPLFWIICCCGY